MRYLLSGCDDLYNTRVVTPEFDINEKSPDQFDIDRAFLTDRVIIMLNLIQDITYKHLRVR